jgi:hypothetical protein
MLLDILIENRDEVLAAWQQAIIETYPEESGKYLGRKGNQFANPVGHTIRQEASTLYDQLVGGMDEDCIVESLGNIVRVRAVQQFSPSQAVAFVPLLKPIIRDQVRGKGMDQSLYRELVKFEERIDYLLMAAFDLYTESRERISEIRVNETRRAHSKLVERLNARVEQARRDKDEESE